MQSVKRLDSVRQFCEVLLYGDGNGGADFTDLPEGLISNPANGLFRLAKNTAMVVLSYPL